MSRALLDASKARGSIVSDSGGSRQRTYSIDQSQLPRQRRKSRSPSVNSSLENKFAKSGSLQKASFSSNYSTDNIVFDDNIDKESPIKSTTSDFNFQMKEGTESLFVGSFDTTNSVAKREPDEYSKLMKDQIFRRLALKEEMIDKSQCKICEKKFTLMNSKKNCKFCGCAVCADHSKKSRPDPNPTSNKQNSYRICDLCEKKYINMIVLKDFSKRIRQKDQQIELLQKKYDEKYQQRAEYQRNFDALILQKTKQDKAFKDQMNQLTKEIARCKEEASRSEKENAILNREFNDTHQEVEQLENEYIDAKREYEFLEDEATNLNHQIDAINRDIAFMNRQLRDIDEAITRNKMNKVANSTTMNNDSKAGNTFYMGSYLMDNNSVEPGDSIFMSKVSDKISDIGNLSMRDKSSKDSYMSSKKGMVQIKTSTQNQRAKGSKKLKNRAEKEEGASSCRILQMLSGPTFNPEIATF